MANAAFENYFGNRECSVVGGVACAAKNHFVAAGQDLGQGVGKHEECAVGVVWVDGEGIARDGRNRRSRSHECVLRIVHDLRYLEIAPILFDEEERFVQCAPGCPVPGAGLDAGGRVDRQGRSRTRADAAGRAAFRTRVGAVEGVVDRSRGAVARDGEVESGRNLLAHDIDLCGAVLEERRVGRREYSRVAERGDEPAGLARRASGHGGAGSRPVFIASQGYAGFTFTFIAPPCRFGDHGTLYGIA